jgi:hypothetical protein
MPHSKAIILSYQARTVRALKEKKVIFYDLIELFLERLLLHPHYSRFSSAGSLERGSSKPLVMSLSLIPGILGKVISLEYRLPQTV